MDSAPPHSPEPPLPSLFLKGTQRLAGVQTPESNLKELSGLDIDDLWREAEAESVGLGKSELAIVLLTVGIKYNYGLPQGIAAIPSQSADFFRSLQLRDLALAQACALGHELAWQQFMNRYRDMLRRAAISITSSATLGRELADSLYAELYGLTERGERRRVSPLTYYSGRGSLKGFLRATLAQRNVDHHRRTHRETPLTTEEFPDTSPDPTPTPETLTQLSRTLEVTLGELVAEDRFLLTAWFLDRRTLLEISRILGVHEATVSRRLQRLTARVHDALRTNLQALGVSKAKADEALATDPRDLEVNLRLFLQASQRETFLEQETYTEPERT